MHDAGQRGNLTRPREEGTAVKKTLFVACCAYAALAFGYALSVRTLFRQARSGWSARPRGRLASASREAGRRAPDHGRRRQAS